MDHAIACALFDTAIGTCGIAWTARGIRALQLPARDAAATRARLARLTPAAREAPLDAAGRDAATRISALLDGSRDDLLDIVLDLPGIADFERRVYATTRRILPGDTLTYGEVAQRIGEPGAARAVGRALGRNPVAILVPCHRVLASGGSPGGFSAPGGALTKLRMLAIEGARPGGQGTLFGA